MNLTHKKTPSIPIGQLKRIIYCRLQSSLYVKKDKSCAQGTYQLQHQLGGEGKAPSLGSQTGCLALQVSGSLQETAARPGCYCLPSLAEEGTQTAKPRKQRQRGSGGEGGLLLSGHRDRTGSEKSRVLHTKATQRSSAYKNIVFLRAEKPFMLKLSFCLGGD